MTELSPFAYNLTVLVAAASKDLTVKATVKAELGISGTTDDDLLDTLIHQASARTFSFTGRELASETVRERFLVPCGCGVIWLARTPVSAISGTVDVHTLGITEDGTALTVDTDYEYNPATGEVWRLDSDGNRTEWAADALITAIYTGGYVTLTNLPHDLERAAIELVKAAYRARTRDPALRSKSIPDVYTETYRDADKMTGDSGMPPEVAGMLAPYCRWAVA